MILSKNAVGNLMNRYKAVLGKCRLINTFGSLALAVALTLGSAGLAAAEPTQVLPPPPPSIFHPQGPDDWTGDITITTQIKVEEAFAEAPEGRNITATSITLGDSGSLTLISGARLINGIPGSDGDASDRLAFTMTGGTLTLGGDGDSFAVPGNHAGINASINAKSVNISGGTVNITGKTFIGVPANWYEAAQVGGYRGLTVSGASTTISMNSYSQLFGGGTVGAQFTGGTINMKGNVAATGVDNSAAHIMFGGSGDNRIAGTTAIYVGDINNKSFGVITTGEHVEMSDGSINILNGELLLQPDVNRNTNTNASIVYEGTATGVFNQTGGQVGIETDGKLTLNKGMTYTMGTGGMLRNAGAIVLNDGAHMSLKKGILQVVNGTFVVNGSQSAGYSHLKFSSDNFSTAMQNGSLSINGGFVSAGDSATLDASNFVADNPSAGKISFGSGQGGNSLGGNLYAEAMTITTTDGTIDTVNRGVLTSDTLSIKSAASTGAVKVENTTLNLTGKNSTLTVKENDADATLNIANAGSLLIGADPALYSGPKTATINAAVNVVGGMLMVGYSNGNKVDTAAATFTKNVTVGSDTSYLGTLNVTAGSTMTMGAGATLDITEGTATVYGTLNVTADNSKLKTATPDGALTVESGGRLNATKNSLAISDDYAQSNIKCQLTVNGGGTLKVDGLGSLDLNKIGVLRMNLMRGDGLFDVGNASIAGIDPTGGTVVYNDVKNVGNITSNALRNTTVTEVSGALSGAYAGATLASSGTLSVATDTTLQLTGANGGKIVSDSTGDVAGVTVNGNGTLLLGDADSNNSGTVGNVTFTNLGNSSLQAVGNGSGNFTAGKIVGNGSTAIAASGTTLNTTEITGAGNVIATNNGKIGAANIAATSVTATTGGSISTAGNITAGTVTATGGAVTAQTLTASSDVTVTSGALTTTGTIADTTNSTITGDLTLTDSRASLGDMTVTGASAVNGGSLVANSLTTTGATFAEGAQVTVDTLDSGHHSIIVGHSGDDKSTSLVVKALTLGGGSLLIDPDWTSNGPNTVAALNIGSTEIDGSVGVGQNSMLTIGDTSSTWLTNQVNHVTNGAGLTQNGVTAAMGLKEAQELGATYSLVVDGSMDTSALNTALGNPNTATFADNSLLVVTAAAAQSTAGALNSTVLGKTQLADNAKLRITDAKVGQTYTVLGANLQVDNASYAPGTNGTGWTGSNFSTDSRMVTGTFDATTGVLAASLNSAANVYPKLDGALMKVLDNAYTADQVGPGHVNSDVKGVRFLSRATNDNFIGANSDLAAKTIESAARIAVAGAVPQMTMAASNAAGAAITQRTSIAQPDGNGLQAVALGDAQSGLAAGDAAGTGFGMWIMPLYQGQNAWSMEAGNNYDLKWHGGLGGVAIGGDYTFANALRAGITFNIGGGYAEGEGDLAKTTNSFNFWGLGAYAGWAMENLGVTADVNYTSTYNKVKQDLPGAMQMSELKSDITAYAISSGLRAEYKFNTQYVDIIPHLGVRYMYVNTDSYDVKSSGTVMNGDSMSQNIWTFPVGVTFSKQVETSNGWYVKPSLDLGVLPATGDIDAKSKIGFTGTGSKAELDTRTMDYMSYTGGLGLDFGNNSNLSFGLNYNIQASEHATSHGVFGSARYEF